MFKIKNALFIKSIGNIKDRPISPLPEFAFAGRSNVGKSSLINTLLNRKNIAQVSKSPGKTRSINYFLVNENFYFVDLPGYGFARVSQSEKKRWQILIEKYLVKNEHLNILFVLIDAKVGFKENDLQLIEFLQYYQIHHELILTKADKISIQRQQKRVNEASKLIGGNTGEGVHLFSSKTRKGISTVLKSIANCLE